MDMENSKFEQIVDGQFATDAWEELELAKQFPEVSPASSVAAIASTVAAELQSAKEEVESMHENINKWGTEYTNEDKATIYSSQNFAGEKNECIRQFYQQLSQSLKNRPSGISFDKHFPQVVDETAMPSIVEIQQKTILTREKKFQLISLVCDLSDAFKAEPSLHFETLRADEARTQSGQ
jgi:hypothetical protein